MRSGTLALVEPNTLALAPPDDLQTKVLAYEHPQLVERLTRKLELSREDADALFLDVKRFLFLCGAYPDGLWGPSQKIDAGWHEFLMYTRDYRHFCHSHFGRFIEHTPNDPAKPKETMRPRRTLLQAESIFGTLSDNWQYLNEAGIPALGPGTLDLLDAIGPCDSCGCSPCN